MKLIFKKDESHQIRVFGDDGGVEKDFSYIEMIKSLIKTGAMDEPEIQDGFSEAEGESIKRMVSMINNRIAKK